jgi:HK97 family phage major capsid protein
LSTVLFDRLRGSSVVLGTGIRTLTTDADSVTYPTLTADVAPAWYAEAATITPGDPTFGTLTATPRKLAHLVQFSNEVLDDSDPSIATVLNDHLLRVLALKLDAGLLEGSGTPPEIRGLKNIAGTQTVAAATNGQQPTLDNVADAIALLEAVNVPLSRMRLVVHPRNVATLRKTKASTAGTYLWSSDPAGAGPRSIFGVPVVTTPQLSTNETQGTSGAVANSAYLYDTESLVYVQRRPIEIELDRSRLFNSDQSEMRAKLRGDLISPTPSGIVRITGFLP